MRTKKELEKIIKEIEAIGLRIEAHHLGGFHVHPLAEDDSCIWGDKLDRLILIAQKYKLLHYIDFVMGYVRLH